MATRVWKRRLQRMEPADDSLSSPDSATPVGEMVPAQESGLGKLLPLLLLLVVVFGLVRPFLLEPFYIPSNSMLPALQEGDRILVSKLGYRLGEPERGEIVVFYGPEESGGAGEIYVKRIIGLPGEYVYIANGKTFIQGMPLDEAYLHALPDSTYGAVQVPAGSYFVMGDNRNDSRDSRYWGPVPRENLIGHAVCIFWPPHRARLLR